MAVFDRRAFFRPYLLVVQFSARGPGVFRVYHVALSGPRGGGIAGRACVEYFSDICCCARADGVCERVVDERRGVPGKPEGH